MPSWLRSPGPGSFSALPAPSSRRPGRQRIASQSLAELLPLDRTPSNCIQAGVRETAATDILLRHLLRQQPLGHAEVELSALVGGSGLASAHIQNVVQPAVKARVRGSGGCLMPCNICMSSLDYGTQSVDVARLIVALRRQRQGVWRAMDICPQTARYKDAGLCACARSLGGLHGEVFLNNATQTLTEHSLRLRTECNELHKNVGSRQGSPILISLHGSARPCVCPCYGHRTPLCQDVVC